MRLPASVTLRVEFTTTHHGQEFDKTHLVSGWAVMAHDALLTARLAVRNATGTSQTPPYSAPRETSFICSTA